MRKLISSAIAVSLLTFFPVMQQEQAVAAPADSVCDLSDGTGSETDPFLIADLAEFKEISDCDGADKFFQLTADIDVDNELGSDPTESLLPSFEGHLNGFGFKIKNGVFRDSSGVTGLIEQISGNSSIRNLDLESLTFFQYGSDSDFGMLAAKVLAGSSLQIADIDFRDIDHSFSPDNSGNAGPEPEGNSGFIFGTVDDSVVTLERIRGFSDSISAPSINGLNSGSAIGQTIGSEVSIEDYFFHGAVGTVGGAAGGLIGRVGGTAAVDADDVLNVTSVAIHAMVKNDDDSNVVRTDPQNDEVYVGGLYGILANTEGQTTTNAASVKVHLNTATDEVPPGSFGWLAGKILRGAIFDDIYIGAEEDLFNSSGTFPDPTSGGSHIVCRFANGDFDPQVILGDVIFNTKERADYSKNDRLTETASCIQENDNKDETPSNLNDVPYSVFEGFESTNGESMRSGFNMEQTSVYSSKPYASTWVYEGEPKLSWAENVQEYSNIAFRTELDYRTGYVEQEISDFSNYAHRVFFAIPDATGDVPAAIYSTGTLTLPDAADINFSKEDAELKGWKDADSQTSYDLGEQITITGDERLIPVWNDACQPGTYSATGFAPCSDAGPGTYVDSVGATSAESCLAGSFSTAQANDSCTEAEAGFYVPSSGMDEQLVCPVGTFSSGTGAIECTTARPGYQAPIVGWSPSDGQFELFTGPGAKQEVICPPGTYSTGGVESCNDAIAGEKVSGSGNLFPELCPPGEFSSNPQADTCVSAEPGHFAQSYGSTEQTACSSGTFSSGSGNSSCTTASAGRYATKASFNEDDNLERSFDGIGADLEKECPAGTYSPGGLSFCLDADPGHYVASPGEASQTECEAGTYQPNSGQTECFDSQPGFYVPMTAQSAQLKCDWGTYQPDPKQDTCIEAEPGYFVSTTGSTDRTACEAGRYSTGGATDCVSADPGYFVPTSGLSYQLACTEGTYAVSGGADECEEVPAGYFADNPQSQQATLCAAGSYSSPGADECISAERGYFVPEQFDENNDRVAFGSPVPCDAGEYTDTRGATECKTAPAGSFTAASASVLPTACPVGFYQPTAGSTSCLQVPNGFGAVEFTGNSQGMSIGSIGIEICAAGEVSSAGDATCEPVSPGYYADSLEVDDPLSDNSGDKVNINIAKLCEVGTYSSATGETTCTQAQPGFYVAGKGATEQVACPAGTYSTNPQSSTCVVPAPGMQINADQTGAIDCEPGRYSVGDGNGCILAEEGHYVPDPTGSEKRTKQFACSAGKYQPNQGETTCLDAQTGTYVGGTGATEATDCAAGTYSDSVGSVYCKQASPGYFVSTTAASNQQNCPAGTFSSAPGSTSCTEAPAGSYALTDYQFAAIPCPLNTNSNPGASECTPLEEFEPTTPPESEESTGGSAGAGGGGGGAVGSAPAVETNPVVAGTNSEGETLAISEGEWQGDSLEFSYQWYRCDEKLESPTQLQVLIDCDLIQGATNETYQLTSADEDKHLLASISASDGSLSTTAFSDTIAPGETLEGEISAETDEPASDAATSTGYWTKRNGDNVKMYAKNIIGLGKVQFFMNGEEIAWIRAADRTDPKLRVITEGHMKGASYLVRDKDLLPGKNVFEIYLDGERVERRIASLN